VAKAPFAARALPEAQALPAASALAGVRAPFAALGLVVARARLVACPGAAGSGAAVAPDARPACGLERGRVRALDRPAPALGLATAPLAAARA
jgi:hypothetical protein